MNNINYVTIDVDAVFSALPIVHGEARCSVSLSLDDCIAMCRINLIKNLCNCSATPWPMLSSTTTETCDLQLYQSCLKFNGIDDSHCASSCLGLCNRTAFKFYSIQKIASYNSYGLQLTLKNMNYPVFEESFQWGINDLIGAVGGIIFLFLGLDFHSILNSFYNFIRIVLSKCRKARKNRIIPRNQEDVVIKINLPNQISSAESSINAGNISYKSFLKLTWRKICHWFPFNNINGITLILFSCLTLQMGSDFIRQYRFDRTVPNIKLMFRQNISLPKSTICLGLNFGELDRWKEKNHTSKIYHQKNITTYFQNANLTKEKILGPDIWPNVLLNVVHAYLEFMTDNEANTAVNMVDRTDNGTFSFLSSTRSTDDLYLAILQLEENMQKFNLTSNELRQKFGGEVNRYFSLQANQINTMANLTVMEQEIPINFTTSISNWGICYQASFDKYPFYDGQRQLIKITTANISKTLPNLETANNIRIFEVDFTDGNRTGLEWTLNIDEGVFTYINLPMFNTIRVDAVYHSLPMVVNGRASCSETISQEGCIAKCRVNLIQKLCNCSATSWYYLIPSNQRECRASDYFTCLEYGSTDDSNCINECVNLCKRWKFLSDELALTDTNCDEGLIVLKIDKFDYPIFTEQVAWTFDTISGSFGNVIRCYLGLDFSTIVLFAVEKAKWLFTVILGLKECLKIFRW